MKNFLIQGLKKSFVCLLTFSFTFSSFSSQSYAGFGIAIDIEDKNLASPAVRVLFLNIDEQKVEEVNYYCPAGFKDAHTYKIPEDTQHKENPLLELIFNNETLQEVVVKSDFTTDKYTVISKVPLRKSGDAVDTYILPTSGDRYYKAIDVPRDLNDLAPKKTPKKAEKPAKKTKKTPEPAVVKSPTHKPTFRSIDIKSNEQVKDDFLQKVLGGDKGNAQDYREHKEKMGEHATLLTLLEYGYSKVYDTKQKGKKQKGQAGMDFMVFSGADPSKDTFLLVESKWVPDTDSTQALLDQYLNNDLIISRLQKLSKAAAAESILAMNLVRGFFTTPGAKICKFFYKIFDKKTVPIRARGVGSAAYKVMTEQERLEIGTKAGIIKPQVPAKPLPDVTSSLPEKVLPDFISSLISNNVSLAPLSEFLKNQYPVQYEEYWNNWERPVWDFVNSLPMTPPEGVDVKNTNNSSLPSEDDSISSEDLTTSFGKKPLSFGSASVEPSDNRKPTGKKKKTMGTSKEDPS